MILFYKFDISLEDFKRITKIKNLTMSDKMKKYTGKKDYESVDLEYVFEIKTPFFYDPENKKIFALFSNRYKSWYVDYKT